MPDPAFVWVGDERQTGRSPISVAAHLARQHHEPIGVRRVTDVGLSGCRLRTPQRLSVGSFVTLIVEGLPSLEAWVAWAAAKDAGVTFAYWPPNLLI